MKNIIVITNSSDGNKAIEVQNFSDENVKIAISKLMGVNPSNLQCMASSMDGGIYEIKKANAQLKDIIRSPFENELALEIKYCSLY